MPFLEFELKRKKMVGYALELGSSFLNRHFITDPKTSVMFIT